MKVSTKGRYGLRALVDLAIHSTETHVSLASIAERQKISLNYLEQVFASLRKMGIVKSMKGSQGGYTLGNKPEQITVAAILKILEGEVNIIDENIYYDEKDAIQSAVYNLVWSRINENMNAYLNSTTLADLAEEYKRLNENQKDMYYI